MINRIDAETIPLRRPVKEFTEDGETLLYHPIRDEATILNQSATQVWRLCNGKSNLHEITAALGEQYGVEGALLEEDVATTLNELYSRNLIELQYL